jgi:hypothetical protein
MKEIFHKILEKSDKEVLLETVSTFLAFPKPNSKSHKYIEYIINLKKFSPKRLLSLNYDYKIIILLSFFEDLSPYIKARKSLIKNSLKNAFITYISSSKEKRIYTEKFLLYLSRFENFPKLNDEKYNLNIDNFISNKKYINALYGFNKQDRKKAFNILLRNIKYGI